MDISISDYLDSFDCVKKIGKCKACDKSVQWAKERLAAHKRSSCPNASVEEKRLFSKRSSQSLVESTSSQQSSDPSVSAIQPGEILHE